MQTNTTYIIFIFTIVGMFRYLSIYLFSSCTPAPSKKILGIYINTGTLYCTTSAHIQFTQQFFGREKKHSDATTINCTELGGWGDTVDAAYLITLSTRIWNMRRSAITVWRDEIRIAMTSFARYKSMNMPSQTANQLVGLVLVNTEEKGAGIRDLTLYNPCTFLFCAHL